MNDKKHTLLIIDDEENILKSLSRLFEEEPYELVTCSSGEEGLEKLKTFKVSVIISDNRMPGMSGIDFFQKAIKIAPDALRVMMTGFTDIDAVISSINKGEVYRYITKPWKDDEIKAVIKGCVKHYELIEQNKYFSELIAKQNEELKDLNKGLEENKIAY